MITIISTSPIFPPHSDLPTWKTQPDILVGLIFFDSINVFILVAVIVIYNGIVRFG